YTVQNISMWRRKRALAAESRALLAKLKARGWRSDAERDDLLRRVEALRDLEPGDVAWMAGDADSTLHEKAVVWLGRFPYDEAAEALFPELASRTESVRRGAMQALETLAGPAFADKMQAYLGHRDPAVVHAALDYARRNPSERFLPGVSRALA